MIVESDITTHPKFLRLKVLVGDIAMELLVRIWAHCQGNKRGQWWPGATPDYIELICSGGNSRKVYFDALREAGWITVKPGGIEIHDWNEHNASLIARWNRVQASASRSAPPAQTPAQRVRSTTPPPAQTPAPVRDMTGHDMTRTDGTGVDGNPPPAAPSIEPSEPELQTPTGGEVNCPPSKTEVLEYAKKIGVPESTALDFFDHYSQLNWFAGITRISNFKPGLEKWHRKDLQWRPIDKSGGGTITGKASPVANRIDLKQQAQLLRERIEKSPANPDSVYSVAEPSAAQVKVYDADCQRLREIETQLRGQS